MKNVLLFVSAMMLVLSSCKTNSNTSETVQDTADSVALQPVEEPVAQAPENSKYNPNDARTFGVVGPVQEVRFSKALLSTTSTEEQGDPWLESNALEMTFDEYGRGTLDGRAGCKYVYDENGKFIKGFSDKTVMVRDDNGRIKNYANTSIEGIDDYSKINFDEYIAKNFEYDELGRVIKATYSGWEWMTDYEYEYFGGNVYPTKATYESTAESLVIKGKITYTYKEYDKYGNWTERQVVWEEETRDCGGAGDPEISKDEYLERRVIKYYQE